MCDVRASGPSNSRSRHEAIADRIAAHPRPEFQRVDHRGARSPREVVNQNTTVDDESWVVHSVRRDLANVLALANVRDAIRTPNQILIRSFHRGSRGEDRCGQAHAAHHVERGGVRGV
jgi:hypothetical protein